MEKTLFKIFFTCNATSCTPKTNPALFSSTEIWYPGKSLSKTVNLINISGDPITINISNENTSVIGSLDTVINLTITRISTGKNVFDNTINNFYGKTIGLPTLVNDTNEDYVFTATMNPDSNNESQNKNIKFDLLFNFTTVINAGQVKGTSTKKIFNFYPVIIILVIVLVLILYFYQKRKTTS